MEAIQISDCEPSRLHVLVDVMDGLMMVDTVTVLMRLGVFLPQFNSV